VGELMKTNTDYQAVTIMRVDWDKHSLSDITRDLRVPRRSTLVMFKGGKEVGRVVAQTSTSAIEALFKAAI
jgi:thioredoxin 1